MSNAIPHAITYQMGDPLRDSREWRREKGENNLSSSLRSCSPAKASDWRLDYRDLLDADIECLEAIERHKRAIARLRREYAARQPRAEAYRLRGRA